MIEKRPELQVQDMLNQQLLVRDLSAELKILVSEKVCFCDIHIGLNSFGFRDRFGRLRTESLFSNIGGCVPLAGPLIRRRSVMTFLERVDGPISDLLRSLVIIYNQISWECCLLLFPIR